MSEPMIGPAVVILGVYRSGTSAVANALSRLGVYFGEDKDLIAANDNNPTGYFEFRALNEINRRILTGLIHLDNDYRPLPADWREHPVFANAATQAKELIVASFSGKGLWGTKDPQSSVLVPFHRAVLGELGVKPVYIVCCRNPIEVMNSAHHTVAAGSPHRLRDWLRYTLGALEGTIGENRCVLLHSDFVARPSEVLRKALGSFDGFSDPQIHWDAAAEGVKKDLVHHQFSPDDLKGYPILISKVFELCLAISQDTKGFNEGFFDEEIKHLAFEHSQWLSIMVDTNIPESEAGLQYSDGNETKILYKPKRSWQTIEIQIPDLQTGPAQVSLFSRAAKVWMRNALWISSAGSVQAVFKQGRHAQLTKNLGFDLVWTLPGHDQLIAELPSGSARSLKLEILVDFSLPTLVQSYASLTDGFFAVQNHIRTLEHV